MMNQTVLIPDGEKMYSFHVVYCLKKACPNLHFIACSDKFNSSFQYSKFVRKCYRLNCEEDQDSIYFEEILRIIRKENVNLLVPCTTAGIDFTLRHRKALEIECDIVPLPERETFDLVSDKWALFKTLIANGIPTPETVLYRDADQFKTIQYPVLLKPINGESGVNIRKLDQLPGPSFIQTLESAGEDYIIQEYIDGYDIDCSILASEGTLLAHTIQMNLGEKARYSPGNDRIQFLRENKVLETVRKTCELLEWTGVAHIDLRYDNERKVYHIIDFNPRFWGSILGSYSAGVNFPYLLYLMSCNIRFESPEFKEKLFVSLRQFLKDAFSRSLKYGLRDTNLEFIIADPVFSIRKLLRMK